MDTVTDSLVSLLIRQWLDQGIGIAYATYGGADNDCPEVKALQQARHLHLDGVSYKLTPKIMEVFQPQLDVLAWLHAEAVWKLSEVSSG